jgi:hypothetical protein
MNATDSSGFEILQLGYPSRDLREWVVGQGGCAGFVHQFGNGRFLAQFPTSNFLEPGDHFLEPTAAFAHLDHAIDALEFAHTVKTVCGIWGGFKQ